MGFFVDEYGTVFIEVHEGIFVPEKDIKKEKEE
jgi:hypothetical protein